MKAVRSAKTARAKREAPRTKAIPMAVVRKPPRTAKRTPTMRRVNDNETIFSGRDLVVPTPMSLPIGTSDVSIFQAVPANPLYWSGTRISRLAQQYQMYRPLKFVVHYHPQVAVTNPGLVVYGTLMQDASCSEGELQQVLNTSNGGGISECYKSFKSVVNCGSSFLQMTSFNTVGDPNTTANLPFIWVASYSGYAQGAVTSSSCPGWVEVEWSFRLINGNAGSGIDGYGVFRGTDSMYLASTRRARTNPLTTRPFGIPIGLMKYSDKPLHRHAGVILLKEVQVGSVAFGIGKVLTYPLSNRTRLDVETTVLSDDGGVQVEVPDDTPVMFMTSGLPQPVETEITVTNPPVDNLIIEAGSTSVKASAEGTYDTGDGQVTLNVDGNGLVRMTANLSRWYNIYLDTPAGSQLIASTYLDSAQHIKFFAWSAEWHWALSVPRLIPESQVDLTPATEEPDIVGIMLPEDDATLHELEEAAAELKRRIKAKHLVALQSDA